MVKEKLGIVSSYNDLCGNASYTKALVEGLASDYEVSVVTLNVDLLRMEDSKSARAHIRQICKELQAFDCVNIQFEAGLFGSHLKSIEKRFFAIAKSCKRLVLTMHRFHGREKYPGIAFLGKTVLRAKIKPLIAAIQKAYANNRHVPMYNRIVRFCKKNQIPILVHTPRDREFLKVKFNYDLAFDHPVCFYEQSHIQSIHKIHTRKDFCQKYFLSEEKVYIGIFGFISKYKGYETIIRALPLLPPQYELLIFGSQHPLTIQLEEPINDYIDKLVQLITAMNLSNRVKFYGLLNDDDFLRALMNCDLNVLPYLEVNQGGSAIAALSLETNAKTIFSQNCAFLELARYAPNGFKMVTIGNHIELANLILTYRKEEFTPHLQKYHETYNIRTSAALYKKLLNRHFLF